MHFVRCRLESYSCKMTGDDKRLFRSLSTDHGMTSKDLQALSPPNHVTLSHSPSTCVASTVLSVHLYCYPGRLSHHHHGPSIAESSAVVSLLFRWTLQQSRLNKAGIKCLPILAYRYIHPFTKSYFDLSEIWHVGRGR